MKFLLSIFFIGIVSSLSAERNPDDFIQKEIAVVQVLNKQSGRTSTLRIPINTPTQFEKITINIRQCYAMDEFLPENFYMFVNVVKAERVIFNGWMSRNEPGQNPLQDPENDLWLTRCE